MDKTFPVLFLCVLVPALAMAGKPHPGWSGDVGLGASSSTGTSQATSVNTDDALHWTRGPWSNQSHLSYNYARSDNAVSANRLALRNDTHYLFSLWTYAFGHVGYIHNPFDGYYYRLNVLAGLGHYVYPAKHMRLALEAAIGARRAHLIGEQHRLLPVARFGTKYRWQIATHARLSEAVEVLLAENGTNTYQSRLAVDTPLYGNLGMRFSFLANYNAQVPPGYKPFNTLTAVNLVYYFGQHRDRG